MKLPSLALLLPMVASSNAAFQHQLGGVHTMVVLAELEAGIAGLTAMSRSMYLELELASKTNAKTAAKDILSEMIVEYNALLIYNHTVSEDGSLKDKLSERTLFASLGAWEAQTTGFLDSIAESAGIFRGQDLEAFVGNLTTFQACANTFQSAFVKRLPDVADLIKGAIDELDKKFASAIGALDSVLQAQYLFKRK